ncbi:hypothetical protein SAMN00790413_04490 [Deinococcus hopiensis KR-140]|uniref:Uncharacterized protein n=1 Tax=Deinococcus hopiensis KR-140 TaxID=695939 RepID=A0A1W1UKA1_9DEIO|nr:hypothetical protein SAMN00790413_04490 [Deinococcus hopiensis KR-140]
MEDFAKGVSQYTKNHAKWRGYVYEYKSETLTEYDARYNELCYKGTKYKDGTWLYIVEIASPSCYRSPLFGDSRVKVPWQK